MRIVAGRHRGRRLTPPSDRTTRPTSDRLRESLFNILEHGPYPGLEGARVADLYAGTGALGLEALSRGATHVTFVESDADARLVLKRNIAALDARAQTKVLSVDARRLPAANVPFDVVFLDPPYGRGLVPPTLDSLAESGWLHADSLVVIECDKSDVIDLPGRFELRKKKKQGGSVILFVGCNV